LAFDLLNPELVFLALGKKHIVVAFQLSGPFRS